MKKRTAGTIAIAIAIAVILMVPVLAQAQRVSRRFAGAGASATVRQGTGSMASNLATSTGMNGGRQPMANLQKRISNVIAARGRRFTAISANLTKRIDRLASLAATVGAAGGDVSGVNADLTAARQHLATAISLEGEARTMLQGIPAAGNRRAAFVAARAKGRAAVIELKLVRVSIRSAALDLRLVVSGLRSADATGTAD